MWHPISLVAESRCVDVTAITKFAELNSDKYGIVNEHGYPGVNTWHVDALVKDFKQILTETETDQHYLVHKTHCCPGHCKYGEVDICPVAQHMTLPEYKCEFCTCSAMNPGALEKAEAWWKGLSDSMKTYLYLDTTRRE